MNPVIVIPSFWDANDDPRPLGERGAYDHATPIDKPMPELEVCLSSLEQVRGVLRVVVLLVAPPAHAEAARARVDGICRTHPRLNPLVVGPREAGLLSSAVSHISRDMGVEAASLRGYGAIRNLGLLVAGVLGHDVVVFMDDDEVAMDPDFLIDAVYGLGMRTHENTVIAAKTGHFLNRESSPYASDRVPWQDRYWSKHEGFNQWMRGALSEKAPRIVRSNVSCGGCLAIHASAFTRVPFDPWIPRGEDLDYLIDLRMYGMDLWFDSKWTVLHLAASNPSVPSRFLQDAYRWTYEAAKLAHARDLIDVCQVTPASLAPYPGPWLESDVERRIARTAFRRAIACREHGDYLHIFLHDRADTMAYARMCAGNYFPFVGCWRAIASELWDDKNIAAELVSLGTPVAPTPVADHSWMELSGGNLGGDL